MPAVASKKKKSVPAKSKKAKLIKYLASVRAKDIFPDKNKKAEENLKHAGLI